MIRKRLTLKNLFEHVSETFFNYDNKLLRTCTTLFTDPVDVIDGYVQGVRKRYVNPLGFFGLSLTLSGVALFVLQKFYIDEIDLSIYLYGSNDGEGFRDVMSSIIEYNSIFFAFLIPFFALISWIVFINKKYNYTEHIVLFFYSMSLLNILSVISSQVVLWIDPALYAYTGIAFFIAMFIYHCYIYKHLFSLSWLSLILKTMLFFIVFIIAYIGMSIAFFLALMLTGQIDLNDFTPN